jgi:hypothetical protein
MQRYFCLIIKCSHLLSIFKFTPIFQSLGRQQDTNETTNRLLRQNFLEEADLDVHYQKMLVI